MDRFRLWRRGIAAITFYTTLPVPPGWSLEFRGIAQFAPLVGILLGGLMGGADRLLLVVGLPIFLRSALAVALGLWLTGGLHLDGAMDAADGLGVPPQRRLAVMADSRSGAFGVMAAVVILGIKTAALTELTSGRWLALMLIAGWSRWGQLWAIVHYPYLRAQGKGRLHQLEIARQDLFGGGLPLLCVAAIAVWLQPSQRWLVLGLSGGGVAIATLIAHWFHRQFGGHTGDTYGATVEWSETALLCLAVGLGQI